MKKDLEALKKQAQTDIDSAKNLEELEKIEIKYFGRKEGRLNQVLKDLKNLDVKQRKIIGSLANEIKEELTSYLKIKEQGLKKQDIDKNLDKEWLDVTLPKEKIKTGHLHPNSIIQYELEDLFKSMGFMVLDGPQLESDYYNFEALNIPKHHPARDMQDTFYIKTKDKDVDKLVLRTHTSNVQVRAMQKYGVPIKAVVPGRVFRFENTDASHDHTFYQMEGLMVDKNISIVNLIAVMKILLKGMFKKDVIIRLRPGFFPFVEPGFELDIKCLICGGHGCSVCKHTGWVELMPCGMIHPNVLHAAGVDSEEYSGFAFGLGLTRMVMMRYGIEDIRHFCSGDLRFLEQF